jgi:hypothetical protein
MDELKPVNYCTINGTNYELYKYLTNDELFKLKKEGLIPHEITMKTFLFFDGLIKIKMKKIGEFKNTERKEPKSNVYLCKSKIGYYLSLGHGFNEGRGRGYPYLPGLFKWDYYKYLNDSEDTPDPERDLFFIWCDKVSL